jgi:hypothetical protein
MPRSKQKKPTLEELEAAPLEYRKRRSGKAEPHPLSEALQPIAERLGLEKDDPTNVQRVRPDGPRKRYGEPATIYTGKHAEVVTDGITVQATLTRDLSAEEHAQMQRWGFDPEDDSALVWNAPMRVLREQGTDPNLVGIVMDGKSDRLGRER